MARRRGDDVEQAIERALYLGDFIRYGDTSEFVEGLETVRAAIVPMIESGEASRAITLIEIFIAGCYEKSEEIDDSLGGFGQFVEELFTDWIRARQGAKEDPAETARMLLAWMDRDNYGYCHDLEKEAVKVLDRAGLKAFEESVQARADGAEKDSYVRRRSIEMLKAIHEVRRDVDAYRALCDGEGDLAPADCEKLAQMCLKRRRPEDALSWVERGLELEKIGRWPNRSAWQLPSLKREILKKLGRSGEALSSAWEDYRKRPSVYSYDVLMKLVPRAKRAEWRAKVLEALAKADLSSRMDLLVLMKERRLLAETIAAASRQDLVGLSHTVTGRAAKSLEKSDPLLAANLHVAMAFRILEAKKSKYYDAAVQNLETARKLMTRHGREDEWEALVDEIRAEHHRKTGFMARFAALAEGRSTRAPSFLERARRRWDSGAGRDRGGS